MVARHILRVQVEVEGVGGGPYGGFSGAIHVANTSAVAGAGEGQQRGAERLATNLHGA